MSRYRIFGCLCAHTAGILGWGKVLGVARGCRQCGSSWRILHPPTCPPTQAVVRCDAMRRRPSSPPPAQLQEATAQADTTSAGSPVAALRAVFTHPLGLAVNPFLPSLPPSTTFTHTHTHALRTTSHLPLGSSFPHPQRALSHPCRRSNTSSRPAGWLAARRVSLCWVCGGPAPVAGSCLPPSVRRPGAGRAAGPA